MNLSRDIDEDSAGIYRDLTFGRYFWRSRRVGLEKIISTTGLSVICSVKFK